MELGREKGGHQRWVEGVALLWWCHSAAQVALPQTFLLDFNNVMDYVVLNNYYSSGNLIIIVNSYTSIIIYTYYNIYLLKVASRGLASFLSISSLFSTFTKSRNSLGWTFTFCRTSSSKIILFSLMV